MSIRLIDAWNDSYKRKENYIFFPKEEVVKFLNRFVAKRVGVNKFKNLIQPKNKDIRALDLGCGIGRQTMLFREFGFDSYGVDISSQALEIARSLSKKFGYEMDDKFLLIKEAILPFEDNYFDIAISDSVLDSMEYSYAKAYILELNRTVCSLVYLNLISSESNLESKLAEDVIVTSEHERGTIQSYYDLDRIKDLISETSFEIRHLTKNINENILKKSRSVRYHIVLERNM